MADQNEDLNKEAPEENKQEVAPEAATPKESEKETPEVKKEEPANQVDDNPANEELERTRKALAQANEEAKNRRLKLREWEDLGIDSDTVKQWKEDRDKAELSAMEEERRYQEIIEKTRTDANVDVQKAQEQREEMKSQLESYLVDKNITEAIAAEEGVPRLLQGVAKQYVKTVQSESGEYSTVVVDDDGLPRKGEDGTPMTIRDLVGSFKDDPDLRYAFKAPKASGADLSGAENPQGKKSGPKKHRSKMSTKDQRDYVAKYGYEEFRKLPR